MHDQFMLSDLVRTAEAVLVFSFVVLVPGYVLAWLLDLMTFRRRALLTRLAMAVPLSIGICPTITYLLWRFAAPTVWVFYGGCALAFFVLLLRERRQLLSGPALRAIFKNEIIFLAIVAGWVLLSAFTLVDLQIGHRLYFPTVTYDYSLRSTVTASIAHSGVPVHNPFFFPGRSYVMHYHYFWFILCGITERIAGPGVSARHSVIAGTIWAGIGLLALVGLYLRFFQSRGPSDVRRRRLYALALLGITGLDIIPVLFVEIGSRGFYADLEWWNEQVTSWVDTVFWTPHQLAGLIACLMGFLLLWDNAPQRGKLHQLITAVTAGVMFSSSVGLTVHVTLAFAIFLVVWMIREFFSHHRQQAGLICVAGITAGVCALPFLAELFGHEVGAAAAAGAFPLRFAVRPFQFLDVMLGLPEFGWKTSLFNLITLPVNYSLELGFFLMVGVIECKRMWHNRHTLTEDQICGFTLVSTCLIVCTFVSSAVGASNDLGWRGFLPVQFMLLLWGGEMLADGLLSPRPRAATAVKAGAPGEQINRGLIVATLVLGAVGSFYALVKIRFYPLLSDTTSTPLYGWLSPDRNLGARTFALRQIYEELRRLTPVGAIFQHNPNTAPSDFFHGIYADRQVAADTKGCVVNFGGDADLCKSWYSTLNELFENPKAFDATQIDEVCRKLSIDVLVVKDTDKIWKIHQSWAWNRKPVLENEYGKAFFCSPAAASWKAIR